ncbi:hypothetical protein TWF696_000941 [Orbilia brochopaga]|uniref:Uncharacterized protein n=1 Tax=Orbilia brochopaga TaxID=3140254 RepID=A0AAV9VFI5_9PEZI
MGAVGLSETLETIDPGERFERDFHLEEDEPLAQDGKGSMQYRIQRAENVEISLDYSLEVSTGVHSASLTDQVTLIATRTCCLIDLALH